MKTNDVLIIGGIAIVIYLLLRKSVQGGGAGAPGGRTGGGCGCPGPSTARIGCPSPSPGIGNWAQGAGPLPPEAFTTYRPPSGSWWDAEGFHLGFDLSF